MAVRPVGFTPEGVEVWHDERGHGGVVPWEALAFAKHPQTGVADDRFLRLPCPVAGCGGESLHPVSGGCDPAMVQRLFTRAYLADPDTGAEEFAAARARAREKAEALEPGRWRADDDEDDEAAPIRGRDARGRVREVRAGR